MNSNIKVFIIFFVFLLVLITGCSKDNPVNPGSSDKIKTSEAVEAGNFNVGIGKQVIKVNIGGDSLINMSVDIPDGAFDGSQNLRISYEEIISHNLGTYFNPVSPLIKIESGTDFINKPIIIDIPVNIPDDHFVILFSYDKSTGKLEPMPYLYSDTRNVKAILRSFNPFNTSLALSKKFDLPQESIFDIFLVASSVPRIKLDSGIIDVGWKPGVDDWQFANMGSYVASGGHCAGQCIAMLWYFFEKKKEFGNLYQRWDNDLYQNQPTKTIWQDDNSGYRLSSVIQKDMDFETGSKYLNEIYDKVFSPDENHYRSICYAMLATNLPQILYITGTDPRNGKIIAHAIVCYKRDKRTLYVNDPNYPSKSDRIINLFNDKWEAYFSGDNALYDGIPFTKISLITITNLISQRQMNKRWDEFINKTIGNDLFPTYTLKAVNDIAEFEELKDGFKKENGEMSLIITNVKPNASLKIKNVYNFKDLSQISVSDNSFSLPNGKSRIGLYLTDASDEYVGFKWINVQIGKDTLNSNDFGFSCEGSNVFTNISFDLLNSSYKYDPSKNRLSSFWEKNDEGTLFFSLFCKDDNCPFTFKLLYNSRKSVYDINLSDPLANLDGAEFKDPITGKLYSTYGSGYGIGDKVKVGTVNMTEFTKDVFKGNFTIQLEDKDKLKTFHTISGSFECNH